MKRVVVVLAVAVMSLAGLAGSAQSMGPYRPGVHSSCRPTCTYVKKMVPCIKSELVPIVKPCTVTVPVKRIGYRCQRFLVKQTPVGKPCVNDPCTRCFPQPCCKVVTKKVPYVYYERQCVPWYNVMYQKVCRKVFRPQTFKVESHPICR